MNRLRPFVQDLVTPNQTGFVAGRRARDKHLLANEILHSIRRKKGKGAFHVGQAGSLKGL